MRRRSLGAVHRVLATARWAMATAPALGAWLVLVAWLVGRIVSDRFLWSQYLVWVPPIVTQGAAAGLVAVAWIGAQLVGPGRCTRRLIRTAAAAWIVVGLVVLIADWHAGRLITGRHRPAPTDITLVVWNLANEVLEGPMIESLPHDADLMILSNPGGVSLGGVLTWTQRVQPIGAIATHQVLGRWPILDSAIVSLDLHGVRWKMNPRRHGRLAIDDGRLAFVTLDARAELGRTLTIWIVDLPSDPKLSRWHVLARTADRASDFPPADLIVGDFNTPRGSRSIRQLTRSMTDAHAAAGLGPDATWPRDRPLWAIDQVYAAPWLDVVRFEVVDPGVGSHRLVVTSLRATR